MSGFSATSFSASPGTDRSPIRVSMGKLEAGGGGESTTSWRVDELHANHAAAADHEYLHAISPFEPAEDLPWQGQPGKGGPDVTTMQLNRAG
jgi:hypothetical protein